MPPKKRTETPEKAKGKAATTSKASAKETPKKGAAKEVQKETPKQATPKKVKEAVKWDNLARDKKATLPITVSFPGGIAAAKPNKTVYSHSLKLEASAPFTLVNTYTVQDGDDKGLQVIVMKPAKAFEFLKLPVEARRRIYKFYFNAKGISGEPIVVDGKRKNESKDPYSKFYASGSKNRVALLAVCKEVNAEATPVLYANALRFDTPATLMNFFANLENHLRHHLRHVEIRQYNKKDAKTALAFLAEARGLQVLRLELNVVNDENPTKAAKAFWLDICKLLEAVGVRMQKELVDDKEAEEKTSKVDNHDSDDSDEEEDDEEDDDDDDEDEEDAEKNDKKENEKVNSGSSEGKGSENEEKATDADSEPKEQAENTATTTPELTKDVEMKEEAPTVDSKEEPSTTEDSSALVATEDNSIVAREQPTFEDKAKAFANAYASREPPKKPNQRQGRKSDAVRILKFSKAALKYKDNDKKEHYYDADMKKEFLDALRAKLNASHLTFWTCVCGTNISGHSCSDEYRSRRLKALGGSKSLLREEFEHLGHGGASMLNEVFDRIS